MRRKGNCWDNAPTERFVDSLNDERVHGARYAAFEAAVADWFNYIDVSGNLRRKHALLG